MPINFNLKDYLNPIFIETGTYIGDGIQSALDAGFETIHSIEFDRTRYLECEAKFKKYNNVHIHHGDSGIVLLDILKTITEPVTFWLDAHYCGDGAEISTIWTPIMAELDAICKNKNENNIILIDDFRCFDNTHIDEKTQVLVGFPGKENLLNYLKEEFPNNEIKMLEGACLDDVVACLKVRI